MSWSTEAGDKIEYRITSEKLAGGGRWVSESFPVGKEEGLRELRDRGGMFGYRKTILESRVVTIAVSEWKPVTEHGL